ncbi:MAG: antitoxin VbhA family protein [Magnetococcus sp. YQC-3]
MLTDDEIRKNLFYAKNAIAQQRLEGLEPSREVVRDLERAAHGEITVRDVIANIGKRHMDAEIRGQRPLP